MARAVDRIQLFQHDENSKTYAKYDYSALANLPRLAQFFFCGSRAELPPACQERRGDIAFIADWTRDSSYPLICLKRQGQYTWVPLAKMQVGLARPELSIYRDKLVEAPYIEIVDRALSRPCITLHAERLTKPEISILAGQLGIPDIRLLIGLNSPVIWAAKDALGNVEIAVVADQLGKPQIGIFKQLERPYIYVYKDPAMPPLHPAILGQAILGRCYLGGEPSPPPPSSSETSALLGKGTLGKMRLGT